MVPGAGIEPARPRWPADFKSAASTNSATRAPMIAKENGGWDPNRKGVHGFAVRYAFAPIQPLDVRFGSQMRLNSGT